jgi:hypothetical protein
MAENGIQTQDIEKTCYQNAISAYGQSGQFNPEDWEGQKIDQSTLFEGNSVLRGQTPTIEE